MNEDWKEFEIIVQMIEHSLSPDSIIERNVLLQELGSTIGLKRECDIVIRTGKPPRETITIVEVQRRSRKVELGDFDSWCVKLEKVGAQHLICVSKEGFPESVKNRAAILGNKVRLITLQNLNHENLPLNFFSIKFSFTYPEFSLVRNVKIIAIENKNDNYSKTNVKYLDKVFSINNESKIALLDLLNHYLLKSGINKESAGVKVEIPLQNDVLWFYNGKNKIKIKFSCEVDIKYIANEVPVSYMNYEQENEGTLAWILEGRFIKPDGSYSCLKIPVIRGENNTYQISTVRYTGGIISSLKIERM